MEAFAARAAKEAAAMGAFAAQIKAKEAAAMGAFAAQIKAKEKADADIAELDAEVARQVAADDAAKASAAHEDQPMADDGEEAMEVDNEARFSPGSEGDDDNGAAAAPAQASVAAPRQSLLYDSYVSGSRVISAAAAGAATHAARAALGGHQENDSPAHLGGMATSLFSRLDEVPDQPYARWDGWTFHGYLSNEHVLGFKPTVLPAGHQSAKWEELAWAWAICPQVGPVEHRLPGRMVFFVTNKMARLSVEEFQGAVHLGLPLAWKGPHRCALTTPRMASRPLPISCCPTRRCCACRWMPGAIYWTAISTGHRPWRSSPPATLTRMQADTLKREYYRAAGLYVDAPVDAPGPSALGSSSAAAGAQTVIVTSSAAPSSSAAQWGDEESRMLLLRLETRQNEIFDQNERLLHGGHVLWETAQETNNLLTHLTIKFNRWPLLEEADKDQAETNLGQFHEQRREQGSLNIDENQVEPCNFINGIANETRTRASINQANKFASNVLGDTVVEEMTKSEPPELAPGSTSSVRGNEKKPPHGRGCVTIQEPSAKHKLRRTLALHAGLRKCAAATTRDPDQAPPQPPLARPPVAHQSRAGSSTGRWRAARRLTS